MALSQRSRTILTLYSASDDVQCHRVRLVLAAKGVVYDLEIVNPKSPPEDLLDLNPVQHRADAGRSRPRAVRHRRHLRIPRRTLSASAADAGRSAVARAPAPGERAHRARLAAVRGADPGRRAAGRNRAQAPARSAAVEPAVVQGGEVLPQSGTEARRLRAGAADLAFAEPRRRAAARSACRSSITASASSAIRVSRAA